MKTIKGMMMCTLCNVHSQNFFTFHGVEDLCRIKSSPARAAENSLVGGIHCANKQLSMSAAA